MDAVSGTVTMRPAQARIAVAAIFLVNGTAGTEQRVVTFMSETSFPCENDSFCCPLSYIELSQHNASNSDRVPFEIPATPS